MEKANSLLHPLVYTRVCMYGLNLGNSILLFCLAQLGFVYDDRQYCYYYYYGFLPSCTVVCCCCVKLKKEWHHRFLLRKSLPQKPNNKRIRLCCSNNSLLPCRLLLYCMPPSTSLYYAYVLFIFYANSLHIHQIIKLSFSLVFL